ncbi:hypothetical protein EIP86_008538 [Pleurotus ostreatoroseus]|nr:hypothetical protein EIP86_008538 [Pleurotus ostreatoroseus]
METHALDKALISELYRAHFLLQVIANPAPPIHYIRTLDPAHLTEGDLVDLSGQTVGLFSVPNLRKDDGSPQLYAFPYSGSAFPPRTRGFLYFTRKEPLAHELRFRLAPGPSSRNFALGVDLRAAGLRWAVPLVYGAAFNPVIAHLVQKDALLSDDEIQSMQKLKRAYPRMLLPARMPLLVARNQLFLFDFGRNANYVMLLMRKQNRYVWLKMFIPSPKEGFTWKEENPLDENVPDAEYEPRKQDILSIPDGVQAYKDSERDLPSTDERMLYNGTALVRFEPSPFARHRIPEFKAMVLRIIKVITPIVPRSGTSAKLPHISEGSFLPVVFNNHQATVWRWPIKAKTGSSLFAMPAPSFHDIGWA